MNGEEENPRVGKLGKTLEALILISFGKTKAYAHGTAIAAAMLAALISSLAGAFRILVNGRIHRSKGATNPSNA
jgi:hypothetical protein